jgi:hypothetical protein
MARRTIAARLKVPFELIFVYLLFGGILLVTLATIIAALAFVVFVYWFQVEPTRSRFVWDSLWNTFVYTYLPVIYKSGLVAIAILVSSGIAMFGLDEADKLEMKLRKRLG